MYGILIVRQLRCSPRVGAGKFKPPNPPSHEKIVSVWNTLNAPAVGLFEDISAKSPNLRKKVYIPFGNWVANAEQQISAKLEKDPIKAKMGAQQTIHLTDRSAVEKSAMAFATMFTALTLYLVTVFIINAIFGYDDAWEGKSAKDLRSNEIIELNRDVAGLRQELKILAMERNKWSIQMQKIQSEIQMVQEENKRLKNKLDDQDITIQLIKKNVVLN